MNRISGTIKRSWVLVLLICLAHYSLGAVPPNTLKVHFSFLLKGVTDVTAAAVQIHRSITENGAESAVL